MVVHRPQVRQVAQVLGGTSTSWSTRSSVHAPVHQRERLRLDRRRAARRCRSAPGGSGRRRRSAARARHSITSAPQPGHLAQRRRPVAGEALHLLRVAGVGHGPDEQVAGVQDPAARAPTSTWRRRSRRGRGAARTSRSPLAERQVVAVGDVRVAVRRSGHCEAVDRERELALVDRRVPADACARSGGSGRAGPRGRRPSGGGQPSLGGLGLEAPGPEDVVDVVVAVHGGAQPAPPRRPPRPDLTS